MPTPTTPVAVPAMTPPPTLPVRGDRTNFPAQSQAWTLWEKAYKFPETIVLANNVLANATAAYDQAVVAAAQAVAAQQQALAAANSASQSAQALASAQAVSGATKWVAGAFASGAVVWSPLNGQNYRARAAIAASAVDPANDSANWFPLLLQQSLPVVVVAVSGTTVASANIHYVITASGVNLQFPSNPNAGDLIGITNASAVTTNTLDPNGKSFRGDTSVCVLNDLAASAILKYTTAQGWIKQ